jgi:Fe-S-cluster-containing dehydrogenase component
MPSANVEDLNFFCDSYVRIPKLEICVAWVVHLHLCLLGCAYCLLACWLGCHMLSRGKGITKVCAIWLQPSGEHMFSS